MENKDQKRARYAFKVVEAINTAEKEYRSVILSAPEMIHQCGLLQSLAFHLSKIKNGEHKYFLQHVLGWLVNDENHIMNTGEIRDKFNKLLQKSSWEILHDTEECQRLVFWLKRFGEKFNSN